MFDFLGLGNGLLNVVVLLAILVGLVVIHELGHFIVARRSKVTVHEFGIGFPPRALTFAKDKQGTIYTLNWLPIGGFVRMEGEEGESDDPNAFVHRSLRTRLTILLAGVTMNLMLALVLMVGIAGFADPSATVLVGEVKPDSPAQTAGLMTDDIILAVDGQTYAWFELPAGPTALLDYIKARPDTPVTLTVQRPSGEVVQLQATTRSAEAIAANEGALGFNVAGLKPGPTIERGLLEAVGVGAQRTADAATLILRALGDFVTNLANPQISGPVGMVGIVGAVREQPPVFLVWLIALLSANLAVVNVLPLPPLDGGRVAVSLLQAALGNRVSVAFERYVYLAGFVFLMALLAWVTLFDTGILQRT